MLLQLPMPLYAIATASATATATAVASATATVTAAATATATAATTDANAAATATAAATPAATATTVASMTTCNYASADEPHIYIIHTYTRKDMRTRTHDFHVVSNLSLYIIAKLFPHHFHTVPPFVPHYFRIISPLCPHCFPINNKQTKGDKGSVRRFSGSGFTVQTISLNNTFSARYSTVDLALNLLFKLVVCTVRYIQLWIHVKSLVRAIFPAGIMIHEISHLTVRGKVYAPLWGQYTNPQILQFLRAPQGPDPHCCKSKLCWLVTRAGDELQSSR
jgi:hypothetical protein